MKILLVTYWFVPHIGGVNTYLNVLKQGLEKLGHQVDILAHHPDMNKIYRLSDQLTIEKNPILFPVHDIMMDYFDQELPELEPWARFREIERYVFEMASALIGLDQYDLIHTHDVISTRAISRVKPVQAAHVATIHGLLNEEFFLTKEIADTGSSSWQYSFIEEHMGASSADITIFSSEWLRREYTNRFFVSSNHLAVIPYGLDTASIVAQANGNPRENRMNGKMVIICPARLVSYKGQSYLIEALGKLLHERDDFICQFAGDGPAMEELVPMADQFRLTKHVQFLGNQQDMIHLYKQADIFVLPTLIENQSLAVMEAQIVGLPVITTRVGGNAELIIPDHTGLLVEPRNPEELYEAIVKLMNDPSLRVRLAEMGKQWARKYWHPQIMIDRTAEAYETAWQMNKSRYGKNKKRREIH